MNLSKVDNQILQYDFVLPEEVTNIIIQKMNFFDVIHFLATCKGLQPLKEKLWKILFQRDFSWRCTLEMEVMPSENIIWLDTYKKLSSDATNIQWDCKEFSIELHGDKRQFGFDREGNIFLTHLKEDEKGKMVRYNFEGKIISETDLPEKVWEISQYHHPEFCPINEAYLVKTPDNAYLWIDRKLHQLDKKLSFFIDNFVEVEKNLFASFAASVITLYQLTSEDTIASNDISTELTPKIIELIILGQGRILARTSSSFNQFCILTCDKNGWTKKMCQFSKSEQILHLSSDGMIISERICYYPKVETKLSVWKINTSKVNLEFDLIGSIDLDFVPSPERRVQVLSSCNLVSLRSFRHLTILSLDVKNLPKEFNNEDQEIEKFLIKQDTKQIVALARDKIYVYTPTKNIVPTKGNNISTKEVI